MMVQRERSEQAQKYEISYRKKIEIKVESVVDLIT